MVVVVVLVVVRRGKNAGGLCMSVTGELTGYQGKRRKTNA